MKIVTHPRMENIRVGDEVYSTTTHLYAQVEATFPAAVCVRLSLLEPTDAYNQQLQLTSTPQLWRADEIENVSICRSCGSRHDLYNEHETGVPSRICGQCRSVLANGQDYRAGFAGE
jgi:hypothetical protein